MPHPNPMDLRPAKLKEEDLKLSRQRLSKARTPTPVLRPKENPPPKEEDPNPPLRADEFQLDGLLDRKFFQRRIHLVSHALRCADWKTSGAIAFLGCIGWNLELDIAGEFVARIIDRYVHGWDQFTSTRAPSMLDSHRIQTGRHIITPPTMHQRVELHDGWPDFTQETRTLVFVALGAQNTEPLEPIRRELLDQTVLVGEFEDLARIQRRHELRFVVLGRWDTWIAVRALT